MNLIIDGNSFLNVSASIVKTMLFQDKRIGAQYWVDDLMSEGGFILKQSAKNEFRAFTVKYLNSITSIVTGIDAVYLAFDSKSWRKNYIRDHFEDKAEEAFDYKGHRKYDEHQHLFYEYFQTEVLEELKHANIITVRVPRAEGDDIIARVIESNPAQDFCIWSTDLDFFQLLEDTPRKVILVTPKMGKKSKNVFSVTDDVVAEESGPAGFDIFNFDMQTKTTTSIIGELKQKGFEHKVVDARGEFVEKVLAGDSSDNIPRVVKAMTAKKVEYLVEQVLSDKPHMFEDVDNDTDNFAMYLYHKIVPYLKITDEAVLESLKVHLKLNISIIRLRSQFFPAEITSEIDKTIRSIDIKRFNQTEYKKIVGRVI